MSSPANTVNTTGQPPVASQTLNQADFLKLLVTQMSSQDPLNPESDTDFAAQLAQFSSLQATQTMSGNLQTIQATGLIGQTVSVTPASGGSAVSGVVTSVQVAAGTPEIVINGQTYNLSQITGVMSTVTTTSNQTAAGQTTSNPKNPTSNSN
jgi:flagellar basal-body rod modification protein FlgD